MGRAEPSRLPHGVSDDFGLAAIDAPAGGGVVHPARFRRSPPERRRRPRATASFPAVVVCSCQPGRLVSVAAHSAATAEARTARAILRPPRWAGRGAGLPCHPPVPPPGLSSGGRSARTMGCREIGRPVVHQPPPLEQVRPRVGGLRLVLEHVGERGLDDFTRMIRLLGGPVPERRPEAVQHSGDLVVLEHLRATSTWLSTSRSASGTRARCRRRAFAPRVEDLQRSAAATRRPRAERTRRARRPDERAADFRPAVPAGPAAGRAEPRTVTAPSPGRSCPASTPRRRARRTRSPVTTIPGVVNDPGGLPRGLPRDRNTPRIVIRRISDLETLGNHEP